MLLRCLQDRRQVSIEEDDRQKILQICSLPQFAGVPDPSQPKSVIVQQRIDYIAFSMHKFKHNLWIVKKKWDFILKILHIEIVFVRCQFYKSFKQIPISLHFKMYYLLYTA